MLSSTVRVAVLAKHRGCLHGRTIKGGRRGSLRYRSGSQPCSTVVRRRDDLVGQKVLVSRLGNDNRNESTCGTGLERERQQQIQWPWEEKLRSLSTIPQPLAQPLFSDTLAPRMVKNAELLPIRYQSFGPSWESSWENTRKGTEYHTTEHATPGSMLRNTLSLSQQQHLLFSSRNSSHGLHLVTIQHNVGVEWKRSRLHLRTFATSSSSSSPVTRGTVPDPDKSTPSESSPDETKPKAIPSRTLGSTRIPTPLSAPPIEDPLKQLASTNPKSLVRKALDMLVAASRATLLFLWKLPGHTIYYIRNPQELRQKWNDMKHMIMHEIDHYWTGTKLLYAEIKTARSLAFKSVLGYSLTRREKRQLSRTMADLFRIVPFSMFIIIPLGELALPFALKVFPNLLPSTFQDSLKNEENMKRELQSRIAMAQFFQETLEELAKEQKRKASTRNKELKEAGVESSETIHKQEDSAASMLQFLESARSGKMIPPDVIIRYARYFQDDLTLENMPRMQLINMCRYMGIPPYGSDALLRFQLNHRIRVLREDDQRILWEGLDSLTKMELREACQDRGMRSTGLSKDAYKQALKDWLELSVQKDVPIAILIMSRTFFLREDMFERQSDADENQNLAGLADAISGLDREVLNEVILEVATAEEKRSDPDVRKIKLEVLSKQNELIREEEKAREAAKKKEEEFKEAAKRREEKKEEAKAVKSDETMPSEMTSAPQVETSEEDDENDIELTPHEMDAISQLISDDPVSKERAELEKIKAAMKGDQGEKARKEETENLAKTPLHGRAELVREEANKAMSEFLEKVGTESGAGASAQSEPVTEASESPAVEQRDEPTDPVVAHLEKKIESMVDKIELQLSATQVKIGDKLHFLDKDKDGILSAAEVAEVLMQVLKRKISFEDALELANEMDGNMDGVFTVEELNKWINEHKLAKLVEEGLDADMDRVIESTQSQSPTDQQKPKEDVPGKP